MATREQLVRLAASGKAHPACILDAWDEAQASELPAEEFFEQRGMIRSTKLDAIDWLEKYWESLPRAALATNGQYPVPSIGVLMKFSGGHLDPREARRLLEAIGKAFNHR